LGKEGSIDAVFLYGEFDRDGVMVGAFDMVDVIIGNRDGESIADKEEVDTLFRPDGG